MNETNLLEDQPVAWTPTPEVIERAQLTRFMKQVGVSTWDELYAYSINDVEAFTAEVLRFLEIKFDPPYEKLLDTTNGVEFPEWFRRNADTPVRNEGEARTTAATFANNKGWHDRDYLPHFDGVVTQFVTFRLADSLPQNVLKRLEQEIEDKQLSRDSDEYRAMVEYYLDQGIGACILTDPKIAMIVKEAIGYEDGRSSHVSGWVVMPNHVHILVRPLSGHSLSDIMKRIKGVSARKINQLSGSTGSVWQPDYFDRYIRDAKHFGATMQYIRENPVKAGLCSSAEEWRFSSFSPEERNADPLVRDEGRFDPNNRERQDQSAMPASASPEEPAIADKSVPAPSAGLNITEMCLDRWQTEEMKDQPAVVWEGENGAFWHWTYEELHEQVEFCAAGLRYSGIGKGDAVGIYLPMTQDIATVLLAIGRIGAIAVPVFSGYGVEAVASRMNAVKAKAIFICTGFERRGKRIDSFSIATEAVSHCPTIEKIFVRDTLGSSPDFPDDRYLNWHEMIDFHCRPPETEWKDYYYPQPTSAEDPLIILYTSGTTGKPKGIAHTHASFPIKAAQDMAFGTDVGKGTRISWYTDIGWMMGPWLIYGALINGATICIYDGAPDYPTPDRMWEFCAKHKVEVLGISPTLVRSLAAAERNADTLVRNEGRFGPNEPQTSERTKPVSPEAPAIADKSVRAPFERHDLSSLRTFASTGEPWNPAPWWWLFEKVGNSKLPIINYSGGTEISGGILMGNPLLPIKPCSFPAPCPGMDVDILDEEGNAVPPGKVGELVIKQPWIGMARGFWQEKERYLDTYWRRFKDIWVHGDFAMRDKDNHWFILGRSDDTLKVAGKRVGPAEVESLLVAHPLVTEAAVIGVPDEVKGTAMVAFVVLRNADFPKRNADALVRPRAADASVRTTATTFANKRGWQTRGYIPHFDGVVTQFVTFRLADSLSQETLRKIKELSENDPADPVKDYRKRVEEYLDRGVGECILLNPIAAQIVVETLRREDERSIDLKAWVIMPNHAHILMRPLDGHSLTTIMKTIKSVSAHRINKELGRSGALWQPDYFDRYIRDAKHYVSALQYIENNPVKAGLCKAADEWEYSSAFGRTRADEGVRVPLEDELKALVARDMGKPLAPSKIHFVSALPKTRNAKVMRRVIRSAYLGEDPGDLSALEDPNAVEEIRKVA